MLASVTSPDEAGLCLAAGADIIDAKDPNSGALGALAPQTVEAIVATVRANSANAVSATIGDLPCSVGPITAAAEATARTGVDYVKVGLLPGGNASAVIAGLGEADTGQAGLVGVLFADHGADFSLIPQMARAGFCGVLIDTADKQAGSLTGIMPLEEIAEFVHAARTAGLFAGLAGSLKRSDIESLWTCRPGIMGFRGALCLDSQRTSALDETLVQSIRSALDRVAEACPAGRAKGGDNNTGC
ncbi:MAG: (5-formylfuran-3-yl)methyl phosphate synthase [Alphaproteobacteria bacterium]|nr:(5-formylfuran-3-yl)methyl phosphate synthase [Alphaproteobacteria bacterium]